MTLTRRQLGLGALGLLLTSCAKPGAPASTSPKLLWAEEFESLSLASPANPQAKWRPNDVWQTLQEGYADFGSGGQSTWCANPAQVLSGVKINPFAVHDSVLTITARRTPPELLEAVRGCPWIGGMLISNTARPDMTFGYGYYEFRAKIPQPAKGMFPALWFFAARDQNPGKEGAEIDLFEIFGSGGGRPWETSLHRGGTNNGYSAAVVDESTNDWRQYGMHWTADDLVFYLDHREVGRAKPDWTRFFAGCKMSIRMDFVMDAAFFTPDRKSDDATPDALTMQIDYVRKYDRPF